MAPPLDARTVPTSGHASIYGRGHILQDEKFPGIHVAFGDPYGQHTGADWKSTTHIDVVATRFNIWVDDRQIMADGKFLISEV